MKTRIKFNDESYYDRSEERDYGDGYVGCDTDESHDIRGFEVVPDKKNAWYDILVGFEPVKETTYYLLYVLHTDGDSFNNYSGKIAYVDMFQDEDKAWENARRIEEHHKINKELDSDGRQKPPKGYETYSVKLVLEDGTEYKHGVRWNGYFERLESIHVEPVRLKSGGTIII